MPLGYGAGVGPRHNPVGPPFSTDAVETLTLSVTARCDRRALQRIVPDGVTVTGDQVSAEAARLRNIPWLAGRGYNIVSVVIPARVSGEHETVDGGYVSVLWESRPEPILTGREDLGFAKIYAEIADLDEAQSGRAGTAAGWDGFPFFSISAWDLVETAVGGAGPAPAAKPPRLHWRYFPATGSWGRDEVSYPVVTPAGDPDRRLLAAWSGSGEFGFREASFEQLPTMFHIVGALAALPLDGFAGASMTLTRGGKDLSDQRRVR